MISQIRQRARVYVWILLLSPLAACVSEPTRHQPEVAAAEQPLGTLRAGGASATGSTASPEVSPTRPPGAPAPGSVATVGAAFSPPRISTAQGIESESSARAAAAPKPPADPATSTAVALIPDARPDPLKPSVAREVQQPSSGPASPGNGNLRAAKGSPEPRRAEPRAETLRSPPSPRPGPERPIAVAGPEASANAPTEVAPAMPEPAAEMAEMAESDPGEETLVAMIPKAPIAIAPEPEVSDLTYDEETLPITFAGGWVLDLRRDALDGVTRCLLFSREFTMFDGYEQTEVQLELSLRAVLVRTGSNIDISYPDQGLRVDGGSLSAFEPEVVGERALYTKQAVQVAMANGERLTLALGFWPTWPVTRTQQATLSLAGFDLAFAALQACAQQHL